MLSGIVNSSGICAGTHAVSTVHKGPETVTLETVLDSFVSPASVIVPYAQEVIKFDDDIENKILF